MSDASPAPSPAGLRLAQTGRHELVVLALVGVLLMISGGLLLALTYRAGRRED